MKIANRFPTTDHAAAGLTFFAAVWSVAALAHLLGNLHNLPTLPAISWLAIIETAVGLAALWVLQRPSAWRRLLPLALFQLANVWLDAPRLGNHWLMTGVINATLLLSLLYILSKDKQLPQSGSLFRVFAPAARLSWLIFYGFAAFNKLNSGFLQPDESCAGLFYGSLLSWLQLDGWQWLQGNGLLQLIILSTVVIELSVPLLLSIRRSRYAGILLGISFHYILALDGVRHFSDFTAMLDALFLLFMPLAFYAAQLRSWQRWTQRAWFKPLQIGLTLFLSGALLARLLYQKYWLLGGLLLLGSYFLWLLYGSFLLWQAARFIGDHWRAEPAAERPYQTASPLFWLLPLLLLANGLAPHLGGKTGSAFNMYSNLRTEGSARNHLLLRGLPRLWSFQEDPVTILSSSDAGLAEYGTLGYQLTYFELRDYLSRHPETAVVYEREGAQYVVTRAGDDPQFVEPLPLLQRKIIWFRPIDTAVNKRCLTRWGPAH